MVSQEKASTRHMNILSFIYLSSLLVTKRLPKMFSTARVLPPSGTVKALVEDTVVVEGCSVVVVFFCGLKIIMIRDFHP